MTSTSHLSRAARAAIAAVVGTVLLWATPPAHAADGGKDNRAIAVNKKDGTNEVRASFQITDLKGDVLATGIEHTGDVDHEGDDGKLEDQPTTPNSPSPEQVGASSETSPADLSTS